MLNILFLIPKPHLMLNSSSSLLREYPVLWLQWAENQMWPLWSPGLFSGFGHLSHRCMELSASMLRFCFLELLRPHDLYHSCYSIQFMMCLPRIFMWTFSILSLLISNLVSILEKKPYSHKQAWNKQIDVLICVDIHIPQIMPSLAMIWVHYL